MQVLLTMIPPSAWPVYDFIIFKKLKTFCCSGVAVHAIPVVGCSWYYYTIIMWQISKCVLLQFGKEHFLSHKFLSISSQECHRAEV